MQCPKCNFDNRPEARFCKQCGQSMPAAAPPQPAPAGATCPACGVAVKPGARFCPSCGGPLLAATAAPRPASPPAQARVSPAPTQQAPRYAQPPTQLPPVQQPYAQYAAQPLDYAPEAGPLAASSSRRMLWLGGIVAFLCIIALIVAAVVFVLNRDDSPAQQASPDVTPGAPATFDAQVSVVPSALSVTVGQPLTVTVTISNSGQVSFDSLRYQLLEGWEPYMTTQDKVIAQDTSIAPAGAGSVAFVMQAAQVGTATLQVNVTMMVHTEPASMNVRQSEKLEISVVQ